jgi:GntR family transcriptional regulator/MocR family aminotransferase
MPRTSITSALVALEIDRSGPVPIYLQLAGRLREAIAAGRLPIGVKLPSTRVFADELGVSRNTVLQVFETLTQEGTLESRVGAGTFVAGIGMDAKPAVPNRPAGEGRRGERVDHGYPFRSLSRRGRSLVASSTGEFSERPTPFMPDLPDLREFPIRTWLRLLNETSGRLTGELLADSSNAGYEPLRRAIAQYLSTSRGMSCDYTQVIITTGSQQSLDLVCRLLLDSGDPVWIEEPCYPGARAVIAANGAVCRFVPVDDAGIRIEEAIERLPVPRLIFTSPSRQYPLGGTLSQARREAMVRVAHDGGSWMVEDDYDHEFRYAGNAPQSLFGLDREHRTIHMGTFSKILLPSFRLGYVVVPTDFAGAFAEARAVVDRHASLIEQMVLSEFMHRGLLAAHIRRMRALYRARQRQLAEGLVALFGPGIDFGNTDTGTHLILPFGDDADDRAIGRTLAQAGVMARPLSPYFVGPNRRRGLLFGFSAFNTAEIAEGLARLARVADEIAPLLQRTGRSA